MDRLEVFFDYICPYCLRAHRYLEELLPEFPEVKVVWRPCESHPRPETWRPHSDLAIQALFCAQDLGADLWAFHDRLYTAAHADHADIEQIEVLVGLVGDLLDARALRWALEGGLYKKAGRECNRYAFEQSGVWAVPAYRMNGQKLDSIEDVGVSREGLRAFLLAAQGKA